MLLANQCAAHFARVKQIPFVYRVHDVPDPERIQKLSTFISNYGYYMRRWGAGTARSPRRRSIPRRSRSCYRRLRELPKSL